MFVGTCHRGLLGLALDYFNLNLSHILLFTVIFIVGFKFASNGPVISAKEIQEEQKEEEEEEGERLRVKGKKFRAGFSDSISSHGGFLIFRPHFTS